MHTRSSEDRETPYAPSAFKNLADILGNANTEDGDLRKYTPDEEYVAYGNEPLCFSKK